MQLILAFLEPPAPAATPWDELDPQARAAALETLTRIILQSLATSIQTEAADE